MAKRRYERDGDYLRAKARDRMADVLRSIDAAYAAIVRRDPCSYCGAPASEADHIDATQTGGRGVWENLTGACRPCNASKETKPLLAFMLGAS